MPPKPRSNPDLTSTTSAAGLFQVPIPVISALAAAWSIPRFKINNGLAQGFTADGLAELARRLNTTVPGCPEMQRGAATQVEPLKPATSSNTPDVAAPAAVAPEPLRGAAAIAAMKAMKLGMKPV